MLSSMMSYMNFGAPDAAAPEAAAQEAANDASTTATVATVAAPDDTITDLAERLQEEFPLLTDPLQSAQ